MATISKTEFERIVEGLIDDRASIITHNPIGSREETLLWMLMSCLVSYLSLEDNETPCFTGHPDAQTYRTAINYILRGRTSSDFDATPYLDKLIAEE